MIDVAGTEPAPQAHEEEPGAPPARYADRPPVTVSIVPAKQAAKRHYGSHQYFTKRAWNVVQAYIRQFTNEGDVVCDPYGGSGVTAVEALVLGRRAIYLDISRWAGFLARQVARAPVDVGSLVADFERVEKACAARIDRWVRLPDPKVARIPIARWHPAGHGLPRNADAPTVEGLFTHRQLLCLSELLHHINRVKCDTNRELLRYAFSATLYMCNRTFISARNRAASRGGSSIFSIYRYKIAARAVELHPFEVFRKRFAGLLAGKAETNQLIGARPGGSAGARFIQGYAQNLGRYVAAESVDYIFTDPPYGAHIAYLDLTRMWDAWLGFETTAEDFAHEIIENGDARHSPARFKAMLAASIGEMFRVLKYDRWMSIVFAHREPAMWDAIVKAAEAAGFEYVNTVAQPLNVIWSMHKKKNPLTVMSGELILNFRKVRNPKTLWITSVGSDALSIVKDSAELSIIQRDGASTDQIYGELIPKLLENGLLGEVADKIGDITPLLAETFVYDAANRTWHVRPGRKIGYHIPLEQRIRFYITDFLNQQERLNRHATIDEIVLNVLPKLKNGTQPTKQKIIDELKKIARPLDNRFWTLSGMQHAFAFASATLAKKQVYVPPRKDEAEYAHDELIYMLAMLGRSAGFACHIGRKEQSRRWAGERLGDLGAGPMPFLRKAERFTREHVEQIDLIWLDGTSPVLAFEIEHTTGISTGIDRFIELLKLSHQMAERVVIVAPRSRRAKMDKVLTSSHYIGAPMYMETKVRYLWYPEVVEIVTRFACQRPSRADVLQAVTAALRHPDRSA